MSYTLNRLETGHDVAHGIDDRLVVFLAEDSDEWFWHRQDPGNHEIVSASEGYTRKDDAIAGAFRANPDRGTLIVQEPSDD